MDEYIYFELNDRKLKMNKNDSNDLWIYYEYYGKRLSKNPHWNKVVISVDTNTYYRCNIGKKRYEHHRIVYYAHNLDWDIHFKPQENPIDHIDENKQNNNISNLRVGTISLNQQNQKNVKGYCWDKNKQRYFAVNGKRHHLGNYKTKEEAIEARKKGKEKYHEW